MEITKVRFYDIGIPSYKNFLSKCSVVFDDCVVLHDIRILSGEKGRYIIMPEKFSSRNTCPHNKNKEGEDVFHPVRQSYSSYMKEVILEGYSLYESKGFKTYIPC